MARRQSIQHPQEPGYPLCVTFRCWRGSLSPAARRCVVGAFQHYDADQYDLYHVVCMPDHVHAILTPRESERGHYIRLGTIVQRVKSYTAHRINRLRGCSGRVWQPGFYSRSVRSQSDFDEKLRYAVENPVRRGLVAHSEDYPFAWNRYYDGTQKERDRGLHPSSG